MHCGSVGQYHFGTIADRLSIHKINVTRPAGYCPPTVAPSPARLVLVQTAEIATHTCDLLLLHVDSENKTCFGAGAPGGSGWQTAQNKY